MFNLAALIVVTKTLPSTTCTNVHLSEKTSTFCERNRAILYDEDFVTN